MKPAIRQQQVGKRTTTSLGKATGLQNINSLEIVTLRENTHRTIRVLKLFFKSLCGSMKNLHLLKNIFSFEAPI